MTIAGILLDDDRFQRIALEAARQGLSIAALIGRAIDSVPADGRGRRFAISAILAAEPGLVPRDPAVLRQEISAAPDRGGRFGRWL